MKIHKVVGVVMNLIQQIIARHKIVTYAPILLLQNQCSFIFVQINQTNAFQARQMRTLTKILLAIKLYT